MIICACGCGEEIIVSANGHMPKYKRWHYQKLGLGNKGKIKVSTRVPFNTHCGCGCGAIVPERRPSGFPHYCRSKDGKFYLVNHRPSIKGNKSHKWKGGRYKNNSGYVLIYVPNHLNAKRDGYILEHRYIWEQINGPLKSNEVVHHINGIRDDNRIENLMALTHSKHSSDHVYQRGGIPTTKESLSKAGKLGAKARWRHLKPPYVVGRVESAPVP
jgi:hypothetical protein